MSKVKLNLVSGAVVEKPLMNAFKSNNNIYVVLDNEINGSMGLPIILVSKLENNKLTKIVAQEEWQLVKEYLKNIIAGGQIEFVAVPNEMPADDIYYTQLTLPVPSFDALKNAYKVEEKDEMVGIADLNINAMDINPINVEPVMPVTPNGEIAMPNAEETPIVPEEPAVTTSVDIPVSNDSVNEKAPEIAMPEAPVENVEPEITPTPVIDVDIPASPVTEDIFKDEKEAFMQACENMFDALAQKFKKELENRK